VAHRHAPHGHRRARHRRVKQHASAARWRRRGQLLTRVSGYVRRATDGTVTISIDRRHRGRWVAALHFPVNVDSAGRFARLLHLGRTGRYRVRAAYMGSPGYRPSQSDYRLVVLRAR
jgi:hypothetical protein